MIAIADTHVALWFLWDPGPLSRGASAIFEEAVRTQEHVGVSSLSICETIYLSERGKLAVEAPWLFIEALKATTSPLEECPLDVRVAAAMMSRECLVIPEMPDRIIAATAISLEVPLITKNRAIRAAGVPTVW